MSEFFFHFASLLFVEFRSSEKLDSFVEVFVFVLCQWTLISKLEPFFFVPNSPRLAPMALAVASDFFSLVERSNWGATPFSDLWGGAGSSLNDRPSR